VPVTNGKLPLKFILDTGVRTTACKSIQRLSFAYARKYTISSALAAQKNSLTLFTLPTTTFHRYALACTAKAMLTFVLDQD